MDDDFFDTSCDGPHCNHEFDPSVILRDINLAKDADETPYIEYVDEIPDDIDIPYDGGGAHSWRFCSLLCFEQWLHEQDEGVTERPLSWPETYPAVGQSSACDHHMQWVPLDGQYECIYECGKIDEYPPEEELEP